MMPLRLPLLQESEDFEQQEAPEARPAPLVRPSGFGASAISSSQPYDRPSMLGLGSRATSRAEPTRRSAALVGRPRPTQRRPIDDFTTVPASLFERLESAAREARNRSALHRLAFSDSTGERYLLHANAEELRTAKLVSEAKPVVSASSAATVDLEDDASEEYAPPLRLQPPHLSRSLSSCAMEMDLAGVESAQRWQVACA